MNLLAVIPAALRALQAGRALNNPAAWKQVQNLINLVTALVAVAAALGYTVPISADGIATVAGGLVALVNVYFTVATTDKIGLQTRKSDDDSNPPTASTGSDGRSPTADLADQSGHGPVDAGRDPGAVRAVVELRQPVPAGGRSVPVSYEPNSYPNLNPVGWGDRD